MMHPGQQQQQQQHYPSPFSSALPPPPASPMMHGGHPRASPHTVPSHMQHGYPYAGQSSGYGRAGEQPSGMPPPLPHPQAHHGHPNHAANHGGHGRYAPPPPPPPPSEGGLPLSRDPDLYAHQRATAAPYMPHYPTPLPNAAGLESANFYETLVASLMRNISDEYAVHLLDPQGFVASSPLSQASQIADVSHPLPGSLHLLQSERHRCEYS